MKTTVAPPEKVCAALDGEKPLRRLMKGIKRSEVKERGLNLLHK